QNPSQGTLFRATQFLTEELPIRLAHRVKELDELPHNLSSMPSIVKVKNWYAQSFEELVSFAKPKFSPEVKKRLLEDPGEITELPENEPNLAVNPTPGTPRKSVSLRHRYYAQVEDMDWPPEVRVYNEKFTKLIEEIKKRHDP
ncbi:17588_t:CDS:2, partial [Acaulospora morrowiae]